MPPVRGVLLETGPFDSARQMALDEALLESSRPNEVILRFYHWPASAPRVNGATFGYSIPYERARACARAKGLPDSVPMIRRATGGGVVFHDGDITFSLVFPWPRLSAPSWVYKNVHLGVHLGLKARNIASRLWSPARVAAGSREPAMECFARAEPADLVREGGQKCLGGALRRRRSFGLYQGSFRPEGFGRDPEELRAAAVDGMRAVWRAEFSLEKCGEGLLEAAERLARERYLTDGWNRRR